MSADRESVTSEHGHERVPGYDVARAIAVCGMVLINFGVYLLGPPRGTPGEVVLRWLAHVPGGRASSLFVTLAGVGIARMAYGDASLARRTLLLRSAVLVLLGAMNLWLGWWIDILHFYACYLAIAALFFLRATPRALLGSALSLAALSGVLAFEYPESDRSDVNRWSIVGVLRDALIDGIHPVVPWLAFLLFGMWLGRLDLRAPALRRTVLASALTTFVLTELLSMSWSALAVRFASLASIASLVHTDWSPSPLYVVSASATATSVIALAHELAARAPKNPIVRMLANAGQLTLTLYLVHAHLAIGVLRYLPELSRAIAILAAKAHVAITLPSFMRQSWTSLSIEEMLVYWLIFVVTALPLAALYRTRFTRGPVEWLMRKVTGSPEHVAPLAPSDTATRELPRWVWLVLVVTIALLPAADIVGVAPPSLGCADRIDVAVGSEASGQLTLLCPRARFAIALDAPTPLVITTRSGLDVYLEVRREGRMIAEDDDSGAGLDARIPATLGPGRYDVDVRPYSAATGPFALDVSAADSRY